MLKSEKLKDGAGRRPDHPDYDPSTLYVPPSFIEEQTPGFFSFVTLYSTVFQNTFLFLFSSLYFLSFFTFLLPSIRKNPSLLPGHQQWWAIKAANFDTILLFKVGKFYELYHMDATVAVTVLNLAYMRVRHRFIAHSF